MKIKSKLFFGLMISIAILFSCEEINDEPIIPDNYNKTAYSESRVEDFNTNQIQCNITIDSLHPYVINNFAANIEFPSKNIGGNYSIFPGQSTTEFGYIRPLAPITEFFKNEYSVKKIIASWHKDSTSILTDSLYFNVTNVDSNFHRGLSYSDFSVEDSTIIYINLLNINRYGFAKINMNDPEIDNYLVYSTNKDSVQNSPSINITPQEFRDKYGDAFCGSLMLGTFNLTEGVVYGVNAQYESRSDALEEVMNIIRIYLTENKEWEELVVNSKYLKNSFYNVGYSRTSKGYSGILFGNYQEIINSADSLYQSGKFNHYSTGFQLYSELYPNFEFLDVTFPY
jgi:hypothetical protein